MLFGIKFWYDTPYGIARNLIFLPVIFVYAVMDEVIFSKSDQNNYHIETDLIVIVLFILLDLILISLRTNSLKNFLKKAYKKLLSKPSS